MNCHSQMRTSSLHCWRRTCLMGQVCISCPSFSFQCLLTVLYALYNLSALRDSPSLAWPLSSTSAPKPTGPNGEYCRVCRAAADEEDARARAALDNNAVSQSNVNLRMAIPSSNVLGTPRKGGDLDVIAIPYVFRYLCAELAAMGLYLNTIFLIL